MWYSKIMNITYAKQTADGITITVARAHLPLFGRWTEVSFTVYCLGDTTLINFGLKGGERGKGKLNEALPYDSLIMSRGSEGNRQDFEQKIEVPHLFGTILGHSDLSEAGVPAGRLVASSILRKSESMIETVRQHIRKNVGQEVADVCLRELHDRYAEYTTESINSFLRDIHWRMMLQHSGCDLTTMTVINTTMTTNPLNRNSLLFSGESDIPILERGEMAHFSQEYVANIKATALLMKVCGKELAKEFETDGRLTVKQDGFTFVIRVGEFVDCIDPSGKTASLCIHTVGFSCNPLDEVIISYLHIRNRLQEWLNMAIAHSAQAGFSKKVA